MQIRALQHLLTKSKPNMAAIDQFRDATVLVTGATGFIGTALCEKLGGHGARVLGVARRTPPAALRGVSRLYAGDLSDAGQTERMVGDARPDVVFHLASHVNGSRSIPTISHTLAGNLVSTINLMTALTNVGSVRSVIIAGSSEEPTQFSHDADETAPTSPYAAAKLSASVYSSFFRRTHGLPVAHARIFMGYGPGQSDLSKLIPYITLQLLRGQMPRLSSGRREVDFIYISDITDGLLALAARPAINTLDIGSGRLVRIADVAEQLRTIIDPSIPLGFGEIPDRRNETVHKADAERSAAMTGWRAQIGLHDGLERTVTWYRNHPEQLESAN